MPLIYQYLLKLSVSLAVVFIFYQLLLRRLTFYTCNRFFLLGYTVLCFFIPLINIASIWEGHDGVGGMFPGWWISALSVDDEDTVNAAGGRYWLILSVVLLTGVAGLIFRFFRRYRSFLRIRSRARLLSDGDTKIYQVDHKIIPFSFGNSIFINHTLHGEEELREIIRHEFVHVRQRHSIDILWAEILCILNWYNPFVWLIRGSIRQNLEFIADHQVLDSGLDKKRYQYMLLKVIGNNHFSIASQFNFSSLKKRIAMMNKVQTSKKQLLRLLLLLPAVAVLLLAFRQQSDAPGKEMAAAPGPVSADTIPRVNKKGYHLTVRANEGNPQVLVQDKTGKKVKTILLEEWHKNVSYYEDQYGRIPPPPPPAPPAVPASTSEIPPPPPPAAPGVESSIALPPPPPPPAPRAPKLPGNARSISITNGRATVTDKNGDKTTFDLNDPAEKAAYEKKYGELPPPPPPPPVPKHPVTEV